MRLLIIFILSCFTSLHLFSQNTINHQADDSAYNYKYIGLSLSALAGKDLPFVVTPEVSYVTLDFYGALRYNDIANHTISLAAGYQLYGGNEDILFRVIPVGGVSIGEYNSLNPELIVQLLANRFSIAGDALYSVSFVGDNLYFLGLAAYYDFTPSFYGGFTLQKTRLTPEDEAIDAGVLFGFKPGNLDLSLHILNFWQDSRYFQISLSYLIDRP